MDQSATIASLILDNLAIALYVVGLFLGKRTRLIRILVKLIVAWRIRFIEVKGRR